ncbi:MAG: motility associated factor glycosyltransferase family protein [Colwellia sp.]|nr:motility associated factor glycosyltransferase family protein [Colwellia sp.]
MPQISDFELDIQTKLLRATFLTNMAVMKKFMPEIFEFYQNYSPTRAKLTFDHNGEVNMVSEGALVYEEHAKKNSYKQAEAFYDQPKLFSYSLSKDGEGLFEHESALYKIYEKREQEKPDSTYNLLKHEQHMDLLTMIGVGLGFHIERLFQLCDVRCFYLYEPDPDCFFCAMHCIDFGPIIDRCFSLGGAFTIKLGGNANQYVNGLNVFLLSHGFSNIARFFNYRHYRSEATDETFKRIYELAYRYSSGWGFFEDEIISVDHTIANIDAGFSLILSKGHFKNELSDKPVFIVGNGPSLDETLTYIKENTPNAIVFSCGTALKSILDAGIIPDFHIEMERTAELYEWVDAIGHKDKLKQINIIALNTVYTKILKLFKNAYLLSKPKDGGMDFLYEFLDADKYPAVDACNPTVSNTATAAAVYLGFKTLYLFGVDFGWIDEEHHHSKGSIYYQKGSIAEHEKFKADMRIAGNFVKEVSTNQHFDNSRASLEILLENNNDIKCFNCSNGAHIELTKALMYSDIPKLSTIEAKADLIESLLGSAFSQEEVKVLNLDDLFQDKLGKLKQIIELAVGITSVKINSRLHLTQLFSNQYKYIASFKSNKETQVLYRFLQGTVNYFQANIMTNAYCYQNKEQQLDYINNALDIFHSHLFWLLDKLAKNRETAQKMKLY